MRNMNCLVARFLHIIIKDKIISFHSLCFITITYSLLLVFCYVSYSCITGSHNYLENRKISLLLPIFFFSSFFIKTHIDCNIFFAKSRLNQFTLKSMIIYESNVRSFSLKVYKYY